MVDIKLATKYIVQTYSVKIAVFSNLKQAWILELNLKWKILPARTPKLKQSESLLIW